MKKVGDKIPNISLPDASGKSHSLNTLAKPAVVALFKVGCPTCQYTFPFLERLHKSASDMQVIGISQDSARDTQDFAKRFGITFPLLLDDKRYAISRQFGITIVPSIFRVETDGSIAQVIEGWVRPEFEQLVKPAGSAPPVQLFKPGENVAAFKAG